MNRKLEQCNSCNRWNKKENRMRNKLWCKFNCQVRQEHEYQIALAYNKGVGGSKYEHGRLVLGQIRSRQDDIYI